MKKEEFNEKKAPQENNDTIDTPTQDAKSEIESKRDIAPLLAKMTIDKKKLDNGEQSSKIFLDLKDNVRI